MKRLSVLLLPAFLFASTITKTLVFDPQSLRISEANGFDVVQLADCFPGCAISWRAEPGKPSLPMAVVNFVIPANATVVNVSVTVVEEKEIFGAYRLHPGQEPVPLSQKRLPGFVGPDPVVYSSNQPYPGRVYEWNGYTGTMMGWRVCGVGVYPLSYQPASGKLTLYQKVTVKITYDEGKVIPPVLSERQKRAFAEAVRSMVANPEDVNRFSPPERESDANDCNYAIITNSSLAASFSNLAEWRTKKGFITKVFKTDSIQNVYSGRDLQEKIRNFIIDYWNNHGLIYVLLAGDNSIVPARRGRVVISGETGNIPADVYYADLQWSWDGDNDNIFGEMSQDTVDLFYDLFVGRASVDNATQVNTFINKTLYYEKTPTTDYLKKMLLPYVLLWTGYSGKIVSDTIAAKTPSDWTDSYIANPTSTTPMRDSINNGYHFCHVAAHGDWDGFYTYYGDAIYTTTTASQQTNSTRPVIMNSIACISGNFEAEDCLAEALMNNANGGAVAAIMNSRYGWGNPPNMGASEKLSCIFYTYYFLGDTVEIGRNHCSSKGVYGYTAQYDAIWRWCYYALNLFGDPALPLWNGAPGTMTVQNKDTTTTGGQTFQVTVTDGGGPVVGAMVCCYKPGEVHKVGYTNSSGVAQLTINPITPGTMFLTVTRKQFLPVEKSVVVIQGAPQPYITFFNYFVDDGNNNRLDPGETADLYVTLKNIGSAPATGVTGILRENSPYLTLIDSTATYGNMNVGDTARGDRFRVTASSSTPPGTQVELTVYVNSPQGSWEPTFQIPIGAPPIPGSVCLEHDTGYCRLSVTALGSIGFTEPPSTEIGAGFCYPKSATNSLYYASFLVGNSSSYIVDRFFGQPASSYNTDFGIVDSLRPIIPPANGDEHFRAVISDAKHPTPKGIKVVQNSYMNDDPGYDDFVVLVYNVRNEGGSPVSGLYAGIFADFDIVNAQQNIVVSNESKRFSYMRHSSSANPTVGVKILSPQSFANLCAIDHAIYVYPTDSAMNEGMKYRILNGTIVQRNSNRTYDWSVGVSVGPFDLNPGEDYWVAFAVVGGSSEAEFEANADSAQSWYDNYVGIKQEAGEVKEREFSGLKCVPNPFSHSVRLSYHLTQAGWVKMRVFDITGRAVGTLLDQQMNPGRIELDWDASKLAQGVYIVKVTAPDGSQTQKLIIRR